METNRLARIREHPARFAVPWSMTIARPVLGALAVHEARQDNWGKATKILAVGAATDFEGTPARFLKATTEAGAKADPIADGVLRGEALIAMDPALPVTTRIVAAAEIFNLGLNSTIQKGRETPFVPRQAKWGSALQAAGGISVFRGLDKNNVALRTAGKVAMLAGTGMRVHAYGKEYKRMKGKSNAPQA